MIMFNYILIKLFSYLHLLSKPLCSICLAVMLMMIFRGSIDNTFLYFPLMLMGCYSYGQDKYIRRISYKLLIVLFFVVFIAKYLFIENLTNIMFGEMIFNLLMAVRGIYGLWGLSKDLVSRPQIVKLASRWSPPCYGAYVIHQFLLVAFLRFYVLPQWLASKWTVWMMAFVIVILSFMLSKCFIKTRAGSYLLG